jgi:CheY-like chemotaxis protein
MILEESKGSMLDSSRHHVLIVDDDASVRDCLALFLQVSGYEVTTAANGAEALALLQVGTPAVLLSDLYMPEMSGFELLPIVRRQFPKLPLVAMSGAYATRDAIPGGVMADAYYAKGHGHLRFLLRILSVMTGDSAAQAADDFATSKSFID